MAPDETRKASVKAYRAWLEELGADGRGDFVDAARRSEDWPRPQTAYLASHAQKWGRGRKGAEYAQWAYDIKNAAGVHVYAYIHPVYGNRGLAFVDHAQGAVVLYDCDVPQNRDLFSPPAGFTRWLKDHTEAGTHWRLRDTER
jgi:hypothetical protein